MWILGSVGNVLMIILGLQVLDDIFEVFIYYGGGNFLLFWEYVQKFNEGIICWVEGGDFVVVDFVMFGFIVVLIFFFLIYFYNVEYFVLVFDRFVDELMIRFVNEMILDGLFSQFVLLDSFEWYV